MRTIIGLLGALLLSNVGHAAEPVWHWIWVTPSPDPTKGWTTFEGDAPVSFHGNEFTTTLNGTSATWQPDLQVRGQFKGKSVVATVVLLNSDGDPERYQGSRWRWRSKTSDPSAGWNSDRIWLNAGPNYIGLYRQIPPALPK